MNDQLLENAELEFLEDTLMKYGDDFSILNASELEGYFTALVSGPELIPPSVWFPAIWDGRAIEWEDPEEMKRFIDQAGCRYPGGQSRQCKTHRARCTKVGVKAHPIPNTCDGQ